MKQPLPGMGSAWLCLLLFLGIFYPSSSQELSTAKATSFHQDTREISLLKVLTDLERSYKVNFAYQKKHLEGKLVVTSTRDCQELESCLTQLLEPLNLTYKKIKNVYVIQPLVREGLPLNTSGGQPQTGSSARFAHTISGEVVAQENSQPLPGVSITLKGTTTGTVTDVNGAFNLTVPDGNGILVFSFIGYLSEEVPINNRTTLNITLVPDIHSLNEVVVTALGITKEKKALAYAVTEVKGEEFVQARENNVANALTGKIAGVNATGLSTGPGGSSRVIIRGNGSLTGANQPLYVINGMPIDNTTPGGSATTNGGAGNVDRGDGMAGINPDDIESISVLKGGTAAALYGSRAANGVILITTKKGKAQKGIGVEFNSSFTMENAAIFPDWQYEYGQGDRGAKPSTPAEAIQTGRRSWGSRIDGAPYLAADGQMHPYVAQKDNIKNFYQTGTTFTNTLAFTGGNEGLTYRFSISDMDSKSILPNTKYNRKTANLNLNGKFGKRISVEALAQYNLEKAHNRPTAGDALGNPNWTPYMIANTADIRWFAPGYDANGNEIAWNDADIASNSYFVANKYQQDDTKNRFIGQAGITYSILDNLSIKGVISRDFYNYNYAYILPTGARYVPRGEYNALKTDVAETNAMATLNYQGRISENFGITALAGVNRRDYEYKQLTTTGTQFIIPYFYSQTNLNTSSTLPLNQRTRTNSVFGSADLDYKGILFLTLTGRQDWFSTLSAKNNSIFYPSIGGSFVLSQAFQLPEAINFAKVRASWAQVGGATPDPYAINLTYSMVPSSGIPLQNVTQTGGVNVITNAGLRPLTSTTYELGLDMQFLQRRLGLDLTFYNRKTTDDIVTTAITPTTGYNSVILNVGELSNKGVEALVTATPIKTARFTWNASYNVAYNKNEVVRLAEGLNSIQMATTVNNYAYINNIVGQPYGTIVGTRIKRDANGNAIYNPNTGFALPTGLQELGNGVPPLTMGLSNDFSYKNFTLNVLLDGKFGNKVFSVMEVYAIRMGLLKSTLPGRDGGLTVNGVTPEGDAYTRTVPVEQLRTYYDNNKAYSELFLHDGSFVKLRQIILTYHIPVSKIGLGKIQSASLSFVARNLAILYRQTDNFDPEQSYTNSSSQGFESFGLPRTRSYGFNLMVKF